VRGKLRVLCGDNRTDTMPIAGDDPFFLPQAKKPAAFDRLLYSVHDIQERLSHRQFNYSHIDNSRYELLDHLFVSEEFVEQNPRHIAEVRNTRIYNDHLFDSKLTSDRSDRPARRAITASRSPRSGSPSRRALQRDRGRAALVDPAKTFLPARGFSIGAPTPIGRWLAGPHATRARPGDGAEVSRGTPEIL
jgi:hypothetical protein